MMLAPKARAKFFWIMRIDHLNLLWIINFLKFPWLFLNFPDFQQNLEFPWQIVKFPDFSLSLNFPDFSLTSGNPVGCDSCLLRSHPLFRSHCLTDRIWFLLCLSQNAFRTMIEMNNRMRSIRSSLTCQSPSDSIQFFKIASDLPIVPDFPSDFPSDPSNHQIIWQWDAGFTVRIFHYSILHRLFNYW